MPSAGDTYSAAQAAELIGVSERRIRQLVAEGKLPGRRSRDGTVRIPQQAVAEERRKRKGGAPAGRVRKTAAKASASGPASSRKAEPVDVDALATAVASAVGQRLEGQLEITRRAESLVRAELDEERARRMELEAKLADAERKLAEADSRRGLFRRRQV